MRIVVLAGGIGGARFLRGLKQAAPDADITVIGNTGDDIHLFGLQVCPDLDTVMYTLGGGINEEQGWGRADETFTVKEELAAYGVGPEWFGLGDRDFATHIVRTQMLDAGYPLSARSPRRCAPAGSRACGCCPMTDDRVETHVVDRRRRDGERRAIHFQEYWVRLRASVPGAGDRAGRRRAGQARARRARGHRRRPTSCSSRRPTRWSASARSSPCPGIREAHRRGRRAGGRPLPHRRRRAGARHGRQGARRGRRGVHRRGGRRALRLAGCSTAGWSTRVDAAAVAQVEAAGIRCRAVPLMMTDLDGHRGDGPRGARRSPAEAAARMTRARARVTEVCGRARHARGAAGRRPRRADRRGRRRACADGDVLRGHLARSSARPRAGSSGADDREAAIDAETVRVVARRGRDPDRRDPAGLVMAAAGVDASNTAAGHRAAAARGPRRLGPARSATGCGTRSASTSAWSSPTPSGGPGATA